MKLEEGDRKKERSSKRYIQKKYELRKRKYENVLQKYKIKYINYQHEPPRNICDSDDGVVANGFPIVGVTGTVY